MVFVISLPWRCLSNVFWSETEKKHSHNYNVPFLNEAHFHVHPAHRIHSNHIFTETNSSQLTYHLIGKSSDGMCPLILYAIHMVFPFFLLFLKLSTLYECKYVCVCVSLALWDFFCVCVWKRIRERSLSSINWNLREIFVLAFFKKGKKRKKNTIK